MSTVKEFFLGTPKEQAAVERHSELAKKRDERELAWDELTELHEKQVIRLRFRLRQILTGLGTLATGTAAAWGLSTALQSEPAPIEAAPIPTPATESAPETKEGELLPIQAEEIRLRTEEAKKWIRAMDAVVKETGNEHAKEVLTYVLQKGVLGVPRSANHGWAWQIIDKPRVATAHPVILMPLTAHDATLEGWEDLASIPEPKSNQERMAGAMYLPDANMMTLKGADLLTEIWQGIGALHEGHHAEVYNATPYNWRNKREYCRRERDAHEFQNDLMTALGGAPYQEALSAEKKRMKEIILAAGATPGESTVGRAAYDPRLDQAFGPSLSTFEENLRATSFWVHANFALIDDSIDPTKAEEEKALSYCTTVKSK